MTVQTECISVPRTEPSKEASQSSRLRRLLEILPLLLMMALVTQVGAQAPSNGDTWFHLRAGHLFWGAWSLWDPGAPTRFATSGWVPTQWCTEMLSAKLEDWFGLPGVAWMYSVLYLAFLVGVYVACRRVASPLGSSVATCGVLFAASTSLATRPQAVSLVLLPVTMGAWLLTRRDGRARWWLIPLTWVWATAHGFWILGVLIGLVCWLGFVLEQQLCGRPAIRMLLVPAVSFVAALLTPIGPKLLVSQFVVGQRVPSTGEWGPTSFRTLPALVLAAMVAAVLVRWLRGGPVGWMPLLLLALAIAWGVLVTRLVAPAAILVAPLMAQAISGHRLASRKGPTRSEVPRFEVVTVVVGAVVCLCALTVNAQTSADHAAGVPTELTPRLAQMPRGTAVLVEDSTGGWLEWRFPGSQPVIDGLLDAYPVDYIRDFQRFRDVKPGWTDFVARTGAHVGVMERGSAATSALRHQLHWRVVQVDREWVLLQAPGAMVWR